MTGYLLDTNIALLGLSAPERISAGMRRSTERGPAFLSVISYGEVFLKAMLGKLEVGDTRAWWSPLLYLCSQPTSPKSMASSPFTRILSILARY